MRAKVAYDGPAEREAQIALVEGQHLRILHEHYTRMPDAVDAEGKGSGPAGVLVVTDEPDGIQPAPVHRLRARLRELLELLKVGWTAADRDEALQDLIRVLLDEPEPK